MDRIFSIPKFAYKDYNHDFSNFNDDNKTVRAMDILFPLIGEIVGGSQREENLDKLKVL